MGGGDARRTAVLEARNLCKSFGRGATVTPVLKNINLQIFRGEFVALVGPSGSGKSTLLSILGLLEPPTSGDVLINHKSVAELSGRQLARVRSRTTGHVFQSFNLLAGLTVAENVMLPGLLAGESGRDWYDRALRLLDQFGVVGLANRVPAELSGGEQQRVAIARALFMTPDVILADEPTGNLDTQNGRKVIDALERLSSSGQTIVLVTHDRSIAVRSPSAHFASRRSHRIRQHGNTGKKRKMALAPRRLAATLSVLRIINLRAIRRHKMRALLAALSLGGGVAVAVAVMIEITSVRTAIDDVGYRIAGPAPLRIVGAATRGGIEPAVINTASRVPGVSATVPVIRAVTLVRNLDHETFVLALGIDCSAQWIIDPKVCQPGQREPPMLATSTTLGRSLSPSATLATDVGQLSMPTIQQVPQLDTVNNGRVVVLPLSAAKAQFARSDRVDILYVKVADNSSASAVRARLIDALGPGFSVLTRRDPARGFDVNTVLLPLLGIFALVAVGVGVILIVQITRLSVEERRREIAVAAALGASPLPTISGFLAEAALLGAAGSVIGILIGIVIAQASCCERQ